MSLSCECFDDSEWFYDSPDDYTTLQTKRRRRCASCNELIDLGSICTQFECYRMDEDSEQIWLADKYHCEVCSDLYFSLIDLGFCIYLETNMHDLVQEYQEVYG